MSSLFGSSRTIDNGSMRARTAAAVRQTAPGKTAADGAAGRLAAQALIDPVSIVPHFLARIATNAAVADAACHDCGYSDAPDEDLLFIVDNTWDDVAATVYPEQPTA